ncbi:hypothetical protein EXIGLDRAFT_777472 [Exidia glandulosa HHB12029]|uniref:Macrofage activating glyco protein n=1 Tax=Exidia glandulosa HHB12029 TaxID=1314781 RepID=A0A165CZN5_EXIGL|nr:hypothetical protein EXIGLDRAFT_777472 [Exidia glandulosa HHB12029]
MLPHILFATVLLSAGAVRAQNRPVPSANPDPTDTNNLRLPFKVDTADTARGIQVGYNQCNSTTQGQDSRCQTLIVNSLEDFCIWGPQTLMEVGNAEAGVVAYCTKPTHGARLIPAGALTGVQFIKTPSYIAVTGRLHQEMINIIKGDAGGELDSGGQDLRGNPIGGVTYSNNLPSSPGTMTQSPVWHYFIGGDVFCMKLCDAKAPNAMGLCEHIYDTYGCGVNVPAAYKDGVFESCLGDDQLPVKPGVTDIPASSSCTPAQSASLYNALPTVSTPGATTTPRSSGTTTPRGTTPTRSPTGSGASSSPTSTDGTGSARGITMRMEGVVALITVAAGLLGAAIVA